MPISIAEVNPTDNNAIIVGWGVTVLVNNRRVNAQTIKMTINSDFVFQDVSVPSSKLRTAAVNLSADCSTANNIKKYLETLFRPNIKRTVKRVCLIIRTKINIDFEPVEQI